jgi:hypothetical protein
LSSRHLEIRTIVRDWHSPHGAVVEDHAQRARGSAVSLTSSHAWPERADLHLVDPEGQLALAVDLDVAVVIEGFASPPRPPRRGCPSRRS